MSDGKLIFDTKIDPSGAQTGMSQLKNILKAGIAGLVAKQAFDIAKMGVSFNAQMEQYQASFKVLLGDGKAAAKHISDLKKMAAKTPFEMGDLAQASQTLLAFGDDSQKVQGHLKMLGDISLGNKEKFSGLSLAFGQVQSQGKLMGQDLLQMINAGFNPLKVISEETGESMSSLKDKMAKGQISFEDVAHAMEVATSKGGQFYKGMETQSETFLGKLSTLKDNIGQLLGKLTSPIFDYLKDNILPKLIVGVDWMLSHLPLVEGVIAAIGAAITTAFAIGKFNAIKTAVMGIGKAIKAFVVANPWLLLAAAIAAVVVGITTFIKAGGNINELGDKINSFVLKMVDAIPGISKKISELIPKIVASITKALPSIIKAVITILVSIQKALIAALPLLISAGISLLMGLVDGLVQAIPILVEALPVIIESLVTGLINALPQIIEAGIKLIEALINGLMIAIPKLVEALPKILLAIVTGLFALNYMLLKLGADLLSKLWDGISSWVGNLMSNVAAMAQNLFNNIVAGIGNLYNAGKNWLVGLWNGISSWVGSLVSNVYNAVTSLPSRVTSGLGNLYSVGVNWLTGLWNGIGSKVEWVKNKVAGIGSSILNKLKSVFKTNSPSRATMAIGKMVGQGLGIGIEDETGGIIKKAATQAKRVLAAYDIDPPEFSPVVPLPKVYPVKGNTFGAEQTQPQQIVNQTININEPVKTPYETARALRKEAINLGLAGA